MSQVDRVKCRLILLLGLFLLSAPLVARAGPDGNADSMNEPAGSAIARVPVPEPTPEATAYYRSGQVLWGIGQVWTLLIPAAWLLTGLSARLRSLSWRLGRHWLVAVPLFIAIYLTVTILLSLPLDYYRGFQRPHAYGLSRESFVEWLVRELKTIAVYLAMAVPILTALYACLARFRRRWWAVSGLATFPFLLFMALIKPVWIDPLFNEFGPLPDQVLEAKILDLAERAGIEGGRVFSVDKSRQTKTINAYVTGFLDTKRIVLWDTIVDQLDEEELLAVMGHEMGHYVLNHVVLGLLLTSLLILVGFGFVQVAGAWTSRQWSTRFGFERLSDVASLPLLLLLALVANFALTPIGFAFSRHMEHEADRFALELTQNNRAAALAFVDLQRENLGYPWPGLFHRLWRSTHPSLGERIEFANNYRPWERGEPLRYGPLIRQEPAAIRKP